jgi:protein gp37
VSELWNPATDLGDPLGWRSSRTVWLHRHADLFVGSYTREELLLVFGVMAATRHTYFLRTRRSDRQAAWVAWLEGEARAQGLSPSLLCLQATAEQLGMPVDPVPPPWPLPNVALGVRATRQYEYDLRVPALCGTSAALRFVDLDPLRERMDLRGFARTICPRCSRVAWAGEDTFDHPLYACPGCRQAMTPAVRAVGWVRLAGEASGRAAPFALAWVEDVLAQARDFAVPVFVRGLGSHPVTAEGAPLVLVDPRGEDPEEWPMALRSRARCRTPFARHPFESATVPGWRPPAGQKLDALRRPAESAPDRPLP